VIAIGAAVDETASGESETDFELGQGTIYIIAAVGLLLILTVFGVLAPAKIRKLE